MDDINAQLADLADLIRRGAREMGAHGYGFGDYTPADITALAQALESLARTQYYLLGCRQLLNASNIAADLTGLGVNWDGGGDA